MRRYITCKERARLDRLVFVPKLRRKDTENFGINHGSPMFTIRGFQCSSEVYEINLDDKLLIQHRGGSLLYDCDKVPAKCVYIFERTINEVVEEFIMADYRVIKDWGL
ncbi:hypothetical protein J4230_00360 [Candidatus Woesearchaeota archaeon]|nr:hypothetical protein [Candidatus Woesearchaeota archaeon]